MNETPNLVLPYILEAQAQKHVTHNEAIRALDALVQLVITSQTLAAPPAAPLEGERYIIAAGATGLWTGKDTRIAAWQDGAWAYYLPKAGWQAWVIDQVQMLYFDGTVWQLPPRGLSFVANASLNGAQTRFDILEEDIALAGAFTDSTIVIPDRAIVFAVTSRTTTAITGASGYDCGIIGDPAKYGGALNIIAGSTNSGVTGPTAFYASTPVRLTANAANFTGGSVRIGIHLMLCRAPTS
ncbi:MAG: ribonuclease III [Robiginitomaculum sp.]|nr:MAG: ribonuclease III [Robiginitomaculum sp.]